MANLILPRFPVLFVRSPNEVPRKVNFTYFTSPDDDFARPTRRLHYLLLPPCFIPQLPSSSYIVRPHAL